uniref:Alternative oxidase n=1 Tax=Eucampia antarctica TaxID=49252 RepID=A0A7S2R6W0_9STRA
MILLNSLLLPAFLITSGAAFTVPCQVTNLSKQAFIPVEKSYFPLHAVEPTQDLDKDYANPSMKFGKPLDDNMKEFNKFTVGFLKGSIFDNIFKGKDRDYARFYALETIARVPYFSYLSVLHLYETLGKWRKANYIKIHFAESWNEMHHLLIMEELGGADNFFDRFLAQHIAVVYYWIVVCLYIWNPIMAYNLNQAIEEHAFSTYDVFVKENPEELGKYPAPAIAKEYYRDGDLYMFDEFQTGTCEPRRPKMVTLYDCFVAIRDDEAEHVKTMAYLQEDVELTSKNDEACEIPPDMLIL